MISGMQHALRWAQRALKHHEVPVGAVIIRNGQVIARAHNLVQTWRQPLAHAEVLCVLQAQKRTLSRCAHQGDKFLDDCDLYVTLQPCPLCLHALARCRIRRVYFGAYAWDGPETHGSDTTAWSAIECIGGVDQDACTSLLRQFFCTMRASSQQAKTL